MTDKFDAVAAIDHGGGVGIGDTAVDDGPDTVAETVVDEFGVGIILYFTILLVQGLTDVLMRGEPSSSMMARVMPQSGMRMPMVWF